MIAVPARKPRRPRDLLDVLIDRPDTAGPGEDDDAYAIPSPDRSWRARQDGRALAFARLGVVFGFLLLLVPGLFAKRDLVQWQADQRFRPRLAWALGGVALWAAALAPLMFTDFRGISLIVGVVILPIVVRVAARE